MLFRKTLFAAVVILAAAQVAPVLAHNDEHAHASKGHEIPDVFKTIMKDYLAIHTALASDSFEKANGHGEAIAKAAAELSENFSVASAGIDEKDTAALLKILPELADTAGKFSEAKNIEAARKAFGPLSTVMVSYRNLIVSENAPNVAYCPMVKQDMLTNKERLAVIMAGKQWGCLAS